MTSEFEPTSSVTVLFTPEFKRNIRQLAKKYRRIKSDLEPLFSELGQGQTPGDQVPGVAYEVYKVRVKNSDNNKGKSGGYRVIYQRAENTDIVLVTIYSKSEQSDIAAQEIRDLILAHDAKQPSEAPESSQLSTEKTSEESNVSVDEEIISIKERN
jgi:mRNA-degrading endonuclease RelE of RelBE toxin-antitoxin system